MAKYTDEQIKKALACCVYANCAQCDYCGDDKYQDCAYQLCEDALDLINRQEAEIERLMQKLQQPQSEAIDNAPAVDAVEVVHGEWKAYKDESMICATEFVCSTCGESFCSGELTDEQFVEMMKYCPNCGAKMDIGKQNEHLRPVVQCRDCKSWQRNSDSLNGLCSCHGITTNYDGSCKDGERTVSAILTVKKYNTDSNFNKRKDKNK